MDPADSYPSLIGDTVHDFYANAPLDRGYPVRIDLLIIYDSRQFELARKFSPQSIGVGSRLEKYLYRFKDRSHKKDALIGVVKILR